LIEVESSKEVDTSTSSSVDREPEQSDRQLSDQELSELLGVSNLLIRDYRVKGKKPPAALAKKLVEWEVRGEVWVRKESV
jgi:hypothetical protein